MPSKSERAVTTVAYDSQIFGIQPFGGVSRYFCEVAARVGQAEGWRSVIVAPLHFNEHLANCQVRKLGFYLPRCIPRPGPLYRAINAVVAPPLHLVSGAGLLHRTYYASSTRPHRAKVVVTVFDLIHEISPHYFSPRDRTAAMKGCAIEHADAVICISQSTANDLQRLLNVPADKIAVTHLGFSNVFAQVSKVGSAIPPRPYLLYVGHRAGYKNFARVLQAYGSSSRLTRDFDLVAFGGVPLSAEEQAQIDGLKLRPNAVRRQVGSDEELARAYAGARALVYPSEYEGFGIPLLEAMSAGCPVVCGNTSSMPEVAGNAAEYFDPIDVESLRLAIERVAYDEPHRKALIERGRIRCRAFSWDRCADETIAVYRKLLS